MATKRSALTNKEKLLWEKFSAAQRGDREAREFLIQENIGLVHKWAKRYYRYAQTIPTLTYDDIFLEGVYGLIKAIEKFKPWKARFSTYATIWIKQSIRRFIQKEKAQMRGRVYPQVSEEEEEINIIEETIPSPEETSSPNKEELSKRIEYANIPQRSKDILHMYFLEGLSLREIGERVGLSKERVRQLIKEDGRKVFEES